MHGTRSVTLAPPAFSCRAPGNPIALRVTAASDRKIVPCRTARRALLLESRRLLPTSGLNTIQDSPPMRPLDVSIRRRANGRRDETRHSNARPLKPGDLSRIASKLVRVRCDPHYCELSDSLSSSYEGEDDQQRAE